MIGIVIYNHVGITMQPNSRIRQILAVLHDSSKVNLTYIKFLYKKRIFSSNPVYSHCIAKSEEIAENAIR